MKNGTMFSDITQYRDKAYCDEHPYIELETADEYCVTNEWKADSKGWCYLDENGDRISCHRFLQNTLLDGVYVLCYS